MTQLEGTIFAKVFQSLSDEHELLQAYSLLRHSHGYDQDPTLQYHLERHLLDGLNRINHLDAAMDILVQVDADLTRKGMSYTLLQMTRTDLVAQLLEKWYGYPPRLNTIADIPTLDMYAQALAEVGRSDDARSVRKLIVLTFENAYGQALGWQRHFGRLKDGYYRSPWNSKRGTRRKNLCCHT